MTFMEALSESMQEHCAEMFELYLQNKSMKTIIHESILEQCGLMQKTEEEPEEGEEGCEEETRHQEEIHRIKKEIEMEAIEEKNDYSKDRFKALLMMIHSDGWFKEEDENEPSE